MKKFTLLTIGSLLVLGTLKAQIKKGTVLLGGGIGFGTSKTETPAESKNSIFYFSPAVGIATKDNLVIGGNLFFSHSEQEISTNTKQNGYGAGAFLRRYLSLGKNFYLFGEGQLNLNYVKQSHKPDPGSETIQRNYGVNVALYPGIAYALTNKVHLEVGLNNLVNIGYSQTETQYITTFSSTTVESTGFNFSAGVSSTSPFNVGFRIVLGK